MSSFKGILEKRQVDIILSDPNKKSAIKYQKSSITSMVYEQARFRVTLDTK